MTKSRGGVLGAIDGHDLGGDSLIDMLDLLRRFTARRRDTVYSFGMDAHDDDPNYDLGTVGLLALLFSVLVYDSIVEYHLFQSPHSNARLSLRLRPLPPRLLLQHMPFRQARALETLLYL
jgi:hypothetical protein